MKRLFIIIGTILILVAIALMIMVFSVEDIPIVQDVLSGMYCDIDEHITHASVMRTGGIENSDDLYFCDNGEGDEYEITGKILLTAGTVFIVPFLIGLMMIMYGAWATQRDFASTDSSMSGIQSIKFADNSKSLSERLQQVENAYQDKLISKAEYDRMRQSILDGIENSD